jgi:membrane-associated phospholipid phosphatase
MRAVFKFLFPFVCVIGLYKSQKLYAHLLLGSVHVAEPHAFDVALFGLSPARWLQGHTHPVLDAAAGLAYLVFIPEYVAVAAYLYFRKREKAPPLAFLAVNALGYLTYFLYPAAPPWYADQHGFGPVTGPVTASPAGCLRFDELFGVSVFEKMYSQSANVFGAIPSLHVSYPWLITWFAWRAGAPRGLVVLASAFGLLMSFSAVYLNHHYVLDVFVGALYAGIVAAGAELCHHLQKKRVGGGVRENSDDQERADDRQRVAEGR